MNRTEVPLSNSVYMYITEYAKNDLDKILSGYSVTYQFKSSNGQWTLELIGDEQNLSKAASDLSVFSLNLASYIGEDFISLPGNFDLEGFIRLARPSIARSMQVLVRPQAGTVCQIIGPSEQLTQATEKLLALAAEHVLPRGLNQSQGLNFTTPFGTVVSIFKGDLIRQQTEAIVNPANENLRHAGGAARAIADAAGPRLVQESRSFIGDHGPLMVSEATHTSSGNLYPPIKYVVHAVGPSSDAYPDVNDQRRLLEATFFNCLSYANNKLNVTSISIPAISSGIHGISRHLVAEAAFTGLQEFERKQPHRSLLTINFVNIDDKSTDAFLEVFRRRMSQNTRTKLDDGAAENWRDPRGTSSQPELTVNIGTSKSGKTNSIHSNPEDETMPMTSDAHLDGGGNPLSMASGAHLDIVDIDHVRREPRRNQFPCDSHGHRGAPAAALQQLPAANAAEMSRTEVCVICMEPIMNPKELPCGHKFCEDCIKDSFEKCQPKCPSCGRLFGVMRGNQPPGKMKVTTDKACLRGYEKYDTLVIEYHIPSGVQNDTHPNPGQPYSSTRRTAFLPNNPEGKEVCDLLRKAFDAGLIFTVGQSITKGRDNQVIWNDIHHKTNARGEYGYPDPAYLSRVKEELKAKGIVPAPARYRCNLL